MKIKRVEIVLIRPFEGLIAFANVILEEGLYLGSITIKDVVKMKAIILARVSTKEQEDGQSTPAQIRRLTEYAEKKQLTVLQVFQITESSTKESRKEFEKIIDLISKSKEPIALIADTVDRVQRGFKESILIEKLLREGKMELHFLRDRLILDKNSNSTDVMRWDMSVMFAKAYG